MSTDGSTPERPAPSSRRAERVEAVRRAVDQAVGATADGTRSRAQDLADELSQVVVRVRGALEDLGSAGTAQAGAVADEVQQAVGRLGKTLDVRPASSDELRRLAARVERLEQRTDARLARIEARLGITVPGDEDAAGTTSGSDVGTASGAGAGSDAGGTASETADPGSEPGSP